VGRFSVACCRADGNAVIMLSKAGQDLTRYFPEMVSAAETFAGKTASSWMARLWFRTERLFSFDHLLQRIHPAASRVKRLAMETPSDIPRLRSVEARQDPGWRRRL